VEQIVAFQNFIVLGIIPGTNIQINFGFWLTAVIAVVIVWELRRLLRSNILAAIMIRRVVNRTALNALTHISDISL
jgi:hypothetical protein